MKTTPAPIARLRSAPQWLRGIAVLVTIAFGMLVLAPAAAAARGENVQRQRTVAAAPSAEAELAATLEQIERRLVHFADRLQHQREVLTEAQDLRRLRRQLERLDGRVQAKFARIAARLEAKGLPAVILDRHRERVASYRGHLARLLHNLDKVEQAQGDNARVQALATAQSQIAAGRAVHAPRFDPKRLPHRSLRPDPAHTPRTTDKAFRDSGLFDNPFPRVASLETFRYDGLAGASDPAYLAASDEVVLDAAVRDRAAALGHDPVRIYHWVRNNVQWQPTWGAVQAAPLTLATRRGNAMDIASLTIALLRAAGIPCRYVHGTVEVPAAQFRNWAGDFVTTAAAVDFAAAGGIPIATVVSGGQIDRIRLEHVWVEAAIDYAPSRGAVNRSADRWLALDPSYQQYQYLPGLDAIAIAGIDPQQLAQSLLASATYDTTGDWIGGVDPTPLQAAQTQVQQRLEDYLGQLEAPTVGDVVGGRRTLVEEAPVLPSGLPNRIVATGARYARLPAALQQSLAYGFARDPFGEPIEPTRFPWSQLNNRQVTLSFRPATAADQETLEAFLPDGEIADLDQLPASLPSYLIEVVPELKVDGEPVKTGAPLRLGETLDFTTRIQFAGRAPQAPYSYAVVAGSFLSVNVFAAGVSPARMRSLKTELEQTQATLEADDPGQIAQLTRERLLGDLFYAGSLGYYAQYLALSHIAGQQQHAQHYLAAGYGTLGYEPWVRYLFGFPSAIEPGGIALDIPMISVSAVADGDPDKRRQYVLQTGMLSSALEHAIPEQLFAGDPDHPPDAISAVKALAKANAQGQRIYRLTPANMAQTLPNIHQDPQTLAEIRAALQVGREVVIHTDPIAVPGWTGAGYIVLDPDTGDGAYKISGGANGGILAVVGLFFRVMLTFIIIMPTFFFFGGILLTFFSPIFAAAIGLIVSAFALYVSAAVIPDAQLRSIVKDIAGILLISAISVLLFPTTIAAFVFGIVAGLLISIFGNVILTSLPRGRQYFSFLS